MRREKLGSGVKEEIKYRTEENNDIQPELLDELYNSLIENLHGAKAPYSREQVFHRI